MSDATQTAASPAPAADPAAAQPAATSPAPAAQPDTLLTADPAAQVAQPSADPAQPAAQADSAADPAKADPAKVEGAPEQYADFTVPEGMKFDDAVLGEFKDLAKELNLPQDKAQKVADIGAKVAQQTRDTYLKQIDEAKAQWISDSRADKEFGGDKLGESMAVAKKALDEYGTTELTTLLRESGLGNHPEIIRTFFRVGQQLSEDKATHGSKAPDAAASAQKFYGNSKMNP